MLLLEPLANEPAVAKLTLSIKTNPTITIMGSEVRDLPNSGLSPPPRPSTPHPHHHPAPTPSPFKRIFPLLFSPLPSLFSFSLSLSPLSPSPLLSFLFPRPHFPPSSPLPSSPFFHPPSTSSPHAHPRDFFQIPQPSSSPPPSSSSYPLPAL